MPEQNPSVRDLTPEEVARGLQQGRSCWSMCASRTKRRSSDFPTPCWCRSRRSIRPRSREPAGREVVFACRSGRRSVTASLAAQEQGFAYGSHLAGGILAWKAAGLPTET